LNFTTHIMFGLLVGGLFFGRPEIMLLMGIGSAIPDLDREYGFLNRESFRRREVHRAVCHNVLFIGIIYLINPYLALGAFLHTLLDAFTSARDRGVEWLYPFSRLIKKAVYDFDGNKMELDPKNKIYFVQNEIPVLTEKTTKDLKPSIQPRPWRRTYGPALSGRLLDQGIFVGSGALTLLLIFFSALGFHPFIDLSLNNLSLPSFILPVLIGSAGVVMNFLAGEMDRKKLAKKFASIDSTYKVIFFFSIGVMIFAIILGAIMNPQVVGSTISEIPFIIVGIIVLVLVSFIMLKIYSLKSLTSKDGEPPII
jgi:LexA-binding, inner membrane-associated putative hydrolase